MSNRYQGGFLTASYFPLKVPDAPTIGTATAGDASASVTFTAPANVGGGAITGYTVTSSPSGFTGTGASSPVTVSGLSNGTAYTFTVVATNAFGTGPRSAASNSVTPNVVTGQDAYTTAGSYSWIAPSGVTSISAVLVGGGGSGGGYGASRGASGGTLRYINGYSVTPLASYAIVVGAGALGTGLETPGLTGGSSTGFGVTAGGGVFNDNSIIGSGGTLGGRGLQTSSSQQGGGGAGGYSGDGGQSTGNGVGSSGTGGAGGGGYGVNNAEIASGGGGVGILGEGSSGAGGTSPNVGGGGGSGGAQGASGGTTNNVSGKGGAYGGGGAAGSDNNPSRIGGTGGVGAVRIIYPGTTRFFPSTNTGNL